MAQGGGEAGGASSEFRLSATLEMRDQLSGKLRSAVSQIKSVEGAVSKLGRGGEVARLAKQFDALNDLRQQVSQFRKLKKSVAATQQAYNQANSATAELARQYKQGPAAIAQLKAKQTELQKTFEQSQSATSQLKSKLSDLKSEAAKAKDSGAVDEYKKLQSQIKSTSAELKSSQAMTRQTGSELKSLTSGIKQAERELNNISSSFEQSKKKAAQLKQELKSQQPALSEMRKSLLSQGFNTRDAIASNKKLKEQIAAATRDLRTQQLRETLSAAGMRLSTERDVYAAQRQRQLRETLSAAGMNFGGGNVNVNVSGNATSKLGTIKKELQSLTQKTWNVAVNAKNAVGGRINDLASGAMLGMGAQMLGTAGIGYGLVDTVKFINIDAKNLTRKLFCAKVESF